MYSTVSMYVNRHGFLPCVSVVELLTSCVINDPCLLMCKSGNFVVVNFVGHPNTDDLPDPCHQFSK